MEKQPYRILLFYKFVRIDDPETFTAEHLQYCKDLGVKGRILIASEGINGTLSGTYEQTERYMQALTADPRFADTVFKIDESEEHAFKKIFVRHKEELVTFRYEKELDPNVQFGTRLSPKEFHEQLQKEEVIVLDGRTDYEYDLGHFRGAIRPDIDSFRDFPQWIRDNMSEHKDKTILTYCTGGIRCEKLTGFMLEEGFANVAQLEGGIVTYGKDPEVQGDLFDGKCYVFDERISVPINQVAPSVVGKCYHCDEPTDVYVNCPVCNLQHLVCESCADEHSHYCSDVCKETVTAV
ncbi:rhodanese-related sulfurtransferase [Saccharibacillus sp. CPCC 101409]|uniref:oxygen-dependent tRNA uridine(34) hydroxylase TrhO n=1 Tax=Saccharibacillus sp. CPCC 101409 TaxID=3058041 RepID=UPI002673819B|nr:rhodanese-related sulfurtransferase [Saccharibacillus sp. CPCC 101409]MDO3411821.1 rhodanese-related sulfurtransferase [Saccharibacillus sp. CPCC 101409]